MLSGVPETALWTLYHRSLAARQGVLDDPKAIALVDSLDYPFEKRFGGGETATWQGLRVRAFDNEIRRVLKAKADASRPAGDPPRPRDRRLQGADDRRQQLDDRDARDHHDRRQQRERG